MAADRLAHKDKPVSQAVLRKTHGVHYTPPDLAGFLARRLVAHLPKRHGVSILDPACGDGDLLEAVVLESGQTAPFTLVGIDRDAAAIAFARNRLAVLSGVEPELIVGDFLDDGIPGLRKFHGIIANPPYVRTQVLGAETARNLASRFSLTGRVDLYQAFVKAMTPHLVEDGVLALLCSNRFLSIQAGASLRKLLAEEYEVCEIVDLGDTKLFSAAVLPAIVVARRRGAQRSLSLSKFVRVYEQASTKSKPVEVPSIVAALDLDQCGLVETEGRVFDIERGELKVGATDAQPWTLTTLKKAAWLKRIEESTELTFGEVGKIRVGIKTTADAVFIRDNWDELGRRKPEPELLHPLITHRVAARWRALHDPKQWKTVLYPHVSTLDGVRRPVDLHEYPLAASYLADHRDRLAARDYVIRSGRQWYEIWVPQEPSGWAKPKIVFPDISDRARFFLDESGAIVNGDCYWLSVHNVEPELASLMLAVANSTFATAFYDAVCGNRLYAGRRRFITQYVKRFPIPRLPSQERDEVHELVMSLRADGIDPGSEEKLDTLVWNAFGCGGPT